MSNAIKETHFTFPEQVGFYKGKVRDVYIFEDQLVVVASDRISAFDVVLPRPIPFKGQVLNQIAEHFLNHFVPNFLSSHPCLEYLNSITENLVVASICSVAEKAQQEPQ